MHFVTQVLQNFSGSDSFAARHSENEIDVKVWLFLTHLITQVFEPIAQCAEDFADINVHVDRGERHDICTKRVNVRSGDCSMYHTLEIKVCMDGECCDYLMIL